MKKNYLYLFFIFIVLSCSTKKNTAVHRFWHSMNTRFNGLFNSTESIKEGQYKIRTAHKDNFDELLPIFVVPENDEEAKKTYPEFDRAIKKASLMIQRHAIKEKGSSAETTKHGANKWIDNCWVNLGIAHYYKREFFSGIEKLDYVTRNYAKYKEKYDAMYWLVRSYNEIGAVSESEVILDNLNSDKKVPSDIKKELYALNADYYIRRGNYKEALKNLEKAVQQRYYFNREKNIQRARCAFVAAQLSEQMGNFKKAKEYYKKVIQLKPDYEMVFYAKMKNALLFDDSNTLEMEKKKKELLQMTNETKNKEYLDVIYYTLGQIEEKQNNIEKAKNYYTLSVRTSTTNPKQKAYSYLKLGDIYFEEGQYVPSGRYYDSAITTLPKTHKNYDKIVARKEVLQNLISYIQGIHELDSLIQLSKFDKNEIDRLIDRLIKQYLAEKEKKQKEQEEKAKTPPPGPSNPNDPNNNPFAAQSSSFYFYNPTAVSYGIQDFIKKWGPRPLEDDWRRSVKNKNTLSTNTDNSNTANNNTSSVNNLNNSNNANNNSKANMVDPKTTKEYYLSKLPTNDSMYTAYVNKIIEYYYLMALTYKEDLNNYQKSVQAFEELNSKYPDNKYKLSSYYQLYLLYQKIGNINKSNEYKEKILSQYPNSEYAQLIKNPNYIANKQTQLNATEQKYEMIYDAYSNGNYQQCFQISEELIQSGLSDKMLQKVEFFKSVCGGRLKGLDTLEMNLKKYIALYPKSELKDRANEILLAISKFKNQKTDTTFQSTSQENEIQYSYNPVALHYFVLVSPDEPKIISSIKNKLDAFNKTYFSNEEFSITSVLFGQKKQIILVKSFGNKEKAMQYLNLLMNDEETINDLPTSEFEFYIISDENYKTLMKINSTKEYKVFFEKNYKANGKS
ncbi:MAG: gliding motility protein [Bacteroidia bacterium]|nr:MAG: gliding motility protein [Bacteroidia bacterium]